MAESDAAATADGTWFEHGNVRIWCEESGSATGPSVLVLPGLFCSIDDLAAIRTQMAEKGMRVLAADLPGSGNSLPQPRAYPADYYTQDAEALAALLQHKQATPAAVIGFSDGGEVALLLAALYPDLVKAVLTWGAMGKLEGETLPAFFHTLMDGSDPEMAGFRRWLSAKYGEEGARMTTQSVGDAFAAILQNGGDLVFARADQIKCPALLLVGSEDTMVSVAAVKELTARLANGRILVVEGGGHGLHESHPHLIADVVHTFLFANHLYPEAAR